MRICEYQTTETKIKLFIKLKNGYTGDIKKKKNLRGKKRWEKYNFRVGILRQLFGFFSLRK